MFQEFWLYRAAKRIIGDGDSDHFSMHSCSYQGKQSHCDFMNLTERIMLFDSASIWAVAYMQLLIMAFHPSHPPI